MKTLIRNALEGEDPHGTDSGSTTSSARLAQKSEHILHKHGTRANDSTNTGRAFARGAGLVLFAAFAIKYTYEMVRRKPAALKRAPAFACIQRPQENPN